MASNENIVTNSIIQITSKDFIQVEEGNFQDLKQAAIKFVNEVLNCYQSSLRTHQLVKVQNLKNGLQYFYQYMRENTNFTKNILQLQGYFETQINNFLGRKIHLAWVSADGHLLFIDQANIGQVIYKKAFGQFGRGGLSENVLKNLESDIEQTLIDKFKKSQELRIGAYIEIKNRWSDPKNKKRFYYHGYYSNFNRRKYTRRFSNLGSIAEGYAGAVINEDPDIIWKGASQSQQQLSIRKLYEKHIQLDSVAGAIKGDVVFNTDENNGNIHFAIKEGSFSTAKFGQFFSLAQNILKIENITKEEFQAQMKSLIKINNVTRAVLEEAYKTSKKELDSDILNLTK